MKVVSYMDATTVSPFHADSIANRNTHNHAHRDTKRLIVFKMAGLLVQAL